MRFKSTIALHATGETIRRDPGFWDKFKKMFGAKSDLDTDRVRTHLTTAHLVQGAKKAIERLGVKNAVALVIDGQVLFEDRAGRDDDVGDMFLSFYENEVVFGRDFKDLRLTVEHRDAGVHYVIEILGRGEHVRDEATARVLVAGRVTDLEPRPGEDAEAFRARVTPHLETPAFVEAHRAQFEMFVERVRDGMRDAMPDVRISGAEPQALVEKPARAGRPSNRTKPAQHDPSDPRYDPYDRYYPSPLHDVATMLFWSSMLSWSWHPHYVVVNDSGSEIGSSTDIADESMAGDDVDSDAGDSEWGDADEGGGEMDDGGGFDMGDGDW